MAGLSPASTAAMDGDALVEMIYVVLYIAVVHDVCLCVCIWCSFCLSDHAHAYVCVCVCVRVYALIYILFNGKVNKKVSLSFSCLSCSSSWQKKNRGKGKKQEKRFQQHAFFILSALRTL